MKTAKPKFDKDGYQTNMRSLNGEPLPDLSTMRVLTSVELKALGLITPEELVGRKPAVTKITLAVDNNALRFFKSEAKRLNTSYQRMMRNLLAAYADVRSLR